jgi:hypothetical protein
LSDDEEMIADKVAIIYRSRRGSHHNHRGMSVDPDDATQLGINKAGVNQIYYSAVVLAGALF